MHFIDRFIQNLTSEEPFLPWLLSQNESGSFPWTSLQWETLLGAISLDNAARGNIRARKPLHHSQVMSQG